MTLSTRAGMGTGHNFNCDPRQTCTRGASLANPWEGGGESKNEGDGVVRVGRVRACVHRTGGTYPFHPAGLCPPVQFPDSITATSNSLYRSCISHPFGSGSFIRRVLRSIRPDWECNYCGGRRNLMKCSEAVGCIRSRNTHRGYSWRPTYN